MSPVASIEINVVCADCAPDPQYRADCLCCEFTVEHCIHVCPGPTTHRMGALIAGRPGVAPEYACGWPGCGYTAKASDYMKQRRTA